MSNRGLIAAMVISGSKLLLMAFVLAIEAL